MGADFRAQFGVAFFGFGLRHGRIFNANRQRSKAAKYVSAVGATYL
jgi:hypothetical protein